MESVTRSFDAAISCIRHKLPDAVAIYRYGSAGTPRERADSDVDLAVLPNRPLPPEELLPLVSDLAAALSRDVDLVDLLKASTVLRAQIVAYGERLYCADERACSIFEDYAYASYARFNEERRDLVADILARGSVYGG